MITTTDHLGSRALWMTLHDSAFPAGRMVHSNGIESWLRAHPDADATRIAELVLDYVAESVAPLDAVVAAHVWGVGDLATVTDLDALLLTYKVSGHARDASLLPGRRLAETVRRVGLDAAASDYTDAVLGERAPGNLAVVESVIQSSLGIDRATSVIGTLRSAMAAALSACVRLGRIGTMAAQRALVDATGALVSLTEAALDRPLTSLHTNTVELDLWGMRHSRSSPRMFAT